MDKRCETCKYYYRDYGLGASLTEECKRLDIKVIEDFYCADWANGTPYFEDIGFRRENREISTYDISLIINGEKAHTLVDVADGGRVARWMNESVIPLLIESLKDDTST